MASTKAEDYLKQSQNVARKALDTNNSLSSKTSDEMFSLLEAGEGSFYLRDQIDNFLDNRIKCLKVDKSLWYKWTTLRQLMSIKDKIAYAVAIEHTHTLYPENSNDNIVDEKILPDLDITGKTDEKTLKNKLYEVIKDIEEKLLTDQEFTESWILRHAAINRFSCNLDTTERAKLNVFANKIKKFCVEQWFDILAESAHFTFESDAQKIIKLNEIISQLSAMGIVIPDDILKEFSGNGEKDKDGKAINWFERHIEKLKSVDKAYKHLTSTLHMVHDTAKITDKSMITPKQEKQLQDVMDKLELRKTIEESIIDFNKEENLTKNSEHWTPLELLKTIRWSSKFNEVVSEMGIENDFDHWFLSWVTFQLTHGAHSLLTKKKSEAFGGDKKKYEEDCNSRRWMMRNKIFEVYDRNTALRGISSDKWDFANPADYERMNSYFTKFPNLFFNSPDDNYNKVEWEDPVTRNALHFDKMRSVLAAILRRRVPALRSSDRIRRWSYPKMIVERARHALKGDERGIFNWIDRQIEHADDASIIAMTIMFQNEANNKLFYEEKDPFEVKPKRYSKIFKKVAGAEKGRQAVRDKFAPVANVALKATETTIKWAVGATTWMAQKWASIINTPLENINGWLSKQSAWNPIKLWMIATKPMQWLLNPLSKGIKTGKDGERLSVTEALSKGYKAGTEALWVKEWEEKKTKYLYQWITRGLESITSFFGKTVANWWQWMEDQYITASKRNVLWALYDAGKKEDRWKDLMTSGWLSDVLNLKNIWPKLFNDDGRILSVDKPAEKYPEDENGITKLQKDIFGKEYDAIQAQIKWYFNDLRAKFDNLDKKLDDVAYWTPEYENIQKQLANLWLQMNTWNDKSDSLNAISVAIQKVATGVSTRDVFKWEIDDIVDDMKSDLEKGEEEVKKNKDIITTCDSEIKKKNIEKAKIEKELSLVSTGDEKTNILKNKLIAKNKKEWNKKAKKTSILRGIKEHENNISKIKDENEEIKKKIEKQRSEDKINKNNLEYDEELSIENKKLEKKESELTTLHSIDSLIKDSKTNLEEIDKKINDWSLSNDKQRELEKQKSETEENIRDLEIKQKNKNSILITLKDEIKKINNKIEDIKKNRGREKTKDKDYYETEIARLEKKLNENEDTIRKHKSDKDILEIELEDINQEINVLTNEIKEIEDKIKSKWGVALSRVELEKKKKALETDIESKEEEKKNANEKIEKQEITNRVLKKITQWWSKIQENAHILADFNDDEKYPEDEKRRKLLKKTLENLDLSFEKKIEVATTSQQMTQQARNDTISALTAPAPVTA